MEGRGEDRFGGIVTLRLFSEYSFRADAASTAAWVSTSEVCGDSED